MKPVTGTEFDEPHVCLRRSKQIINSKMAGVVVEEPTCFLELPDESVTSDSGTAGDESRVFACDHPGCSAAFSKPCRLEWHVRVHDGDRPYKCHFAGCDASYTRSYHLTRHRNKNHTQKADLPSVYRCSVRGCGKILSTKQFLNRHLTNFHEGRPFACSACPKRFRKHQHLRSHEYEHNAVFPHVCPVEGCAKGFLQKQKLDRHLKTHDGYHCPVEGCEERFEKWSAVRKHKAVAHRKLHLCIFCKKDFPRKLILQQHLLTHQNERECFECPDCHSVLVNTEKSIKQHSKRCSAKKVQLKCEFPGCGKVFLKVGNLSRHIDLHSSRKVFPVEDDALDAGLPCLS